MGTQAALDGPRCNSGDQFGVYGRWNTATVGGGPACVRPFAEGEKNGGATAPGVTATSVNVVAVIPSAARSAAQTAAAGPKYAADNSASTWENAIHDYLFANKDFYEQWGRSLDVTLYTSTGTDEAAQQADAVAIKAMKPFAVLQLDSFGLDTLVTSLAKAKILVNSYSTSPAETAAVAPYRWGADPDANAAAANSAEVIGKTLVGKKAEFGGDDVKGQTRKFGLVQVEDQIDLDAFKASLGKYKGTIAAESSYPGTGGALGDAATAQQQAPTMVSRLKDAGVTTVILFTDAGHEHRADEPGRPAELAPRVVLHRVGLRGSPRARTGHARRPVAARARDLQLRPVLQGAGEPRGADASELVLGQGRWHRVGGGRGGARVAAGRHPLRGARPDGEELRAGHVRRAAAAAIRTTRSCRSRGTGARPACPTTPTHPDRPTSTPSSSTRT